MVREIVNKMRDDDTTRLAMTSKTNQRIVLDYRNQQDIERFVESQSDNIKYDFYDMVHKLMSVAVTPTREFVFVKKSPIVKNVDQIQLTSLLSFVVNQYPVYYGRELARNIPMTRGRSETSNGRRYWVSIYANIPKYTYQDISSCFEIASEKIKDECVKQDTTNICYAYSFVCGIGIGIHDD
jgi:hypothetical protein